MSYNVDALNFLVGCQESSMVEDPDFVLDTLRDHFDMDEDEAARHLEGVEEGYDIVYKCLVPKNVRAGVVELCHVWERVNGEVNGCFAEMFKDEESETYATGMMECDKSYFEALTKTIKALKPTLEEVYHGGELAGYEWQEYKDHPLLG